MKTDSSFNLVSNYAPCGDQPEAIKSLLNGLMQGKKKQVLLGVTGSGKTFTVANVIQNWGRKTLVLAHNKTLAAQLFSEFKEYFPNNAVEYFVSYYDYYQPEAYVPGTDTYVEKDASVNDEIDKLRHSATRSLLERDDVIVVASVSCIYGIGSPLEYAKQKLSLFVDQELDRDLFIKRLVEMQYERNDVDFFRGTFRVRGEQVEVFPANENSQVIRIEFFGDNIELISIVDPLRGKKLDSLLTVTIYPKSHYVVDAHNRERAVKTIRQELLERLTELQKSEKLVERQRLENKTLLDLEMLEEMGFCSGIENYSRHLTGSKEGDPPPTLIDYFGDDFLMIIDESHITNSQVGGMYRGDRSRKETLVAHGFRLPSALDNRPLNFSEFEGKLKKTIYVSATPGDYELEKCGGEFISQIIRPTGLLDPVIEVRDATNQVDDLLIEIKKVIAGGNKVLVTTLTKRLAEDLTIFYKGVGIRVRYLHSDITTIERMEIIKSLRMDEYDVLVGINLLREGLDIPEIALVGILDADKEGFLRSERSLIQMIGRAARNVSGRVILYAYKETKSMKKAMEETSRRRIVQDNYNKKNNITPQTIIKSVTGGIIDVLKKRKGTTKGRSGDKIVLEELSAQNIDKLIIELKIIMKQASRELRFEDAAKCRDEIRELVEARLLL